MTHPLGALWVGEHIVEAVVNVGHFHSRPEYGKQKVGFSTAKVHKIHHKGI